MSAPIVLDGALGSQLTERGVDTSGPAWSAHALATAPDVVAAIHRAYAEAGAQVHRANTFRTQPRAVGDAWALLAARAVDLARAFAMPGQLVAGCLGPLADCYRPDLAPPGAEARREHEMLARFLAERGVDLLMGETFPNVEEARAATRACVATGLRTWTSLTAGPDGELMTPAALAEGAARCRDDGAELVLVNCVAAERTLPYVEALAARDLPFGVYANAARWNARRVTPEEYVQYAREWLRAGARAIGCCCGTGPEHVRAVARLAA